MNELQHLSQQYIQVLTHRNYSWHTINQYERELERFSDFVHVVGIDEITLQHVYRYLFYCYEDLHHGNNTRRKNLSILKSFWQFLLAREYVQSNIFYYIDYPKKIRRLPRVLEVDEINYILAQLFTLKKRCNYRDYFIISMLYGSGMRIAELVNITHNDIDTDKKLVRIRHAKGNAERMCILSDLSIQQYKQYLSTDYRTYYKKHRSANYVFLNTQGNQITTRGVQYTLVKIAKMLKLHNIHPHMFRHSFATTLLRNGLKTHEIQVLLGHKSISSTQIYIQVTQLELMEAIQKYLPINQIVKKS